MGTDINGHIYNVVQGRLNHGPIVAVRERKESRMTSELLDWQMGSWQCHSRSKEFRTGKLGKKGMRKVEGDELHQGHTWLKVPAENPNKDG